MSDFGDAIIERVGNSELSKSDNPMNQIITNSVGEWLSVFDEFPWLEQFFLQEAEGKYLDLHGKDYNVLRRIDESDDSYRERMIYETLGQLSIPALETMYNVGVYKSVSDYDLTSNSMVSDNSYLVSELILLDCSDDVQRSLLKRFILTGVDFI